MPNLTLPSGRVVELHDPTFGELIHVASAGAENSEALLYAKFAVIVPSLSREEIGQLSRYDGLKLIDEAQRIWDGRPEEADVPLGDGSTLLSVESSRRITLRPSNGLASTEWQSWRDAWVGRLTSSAPSEPNAEPSVNGSVGVVLTATPGF